MISYPFLVLYKCFTTLIVGDLSLWSMDGDDTVS